jgi:nucleotide-binding universal stress UspA family protein
VPLPRNNLHRVRDRADRAGVTIEHQIVDGTKPARALLRHAHRHSFDLIICGQHHNQRAGRMLLDGVAEDLGQAADVPVLIIAEESQ